MYNSDRMGTACRCFGKTEYILLHYLLPDRRDNDTVNSLGHSQPFHKLQTRTTRFRNCFVPYCL